MRACSKGGGVRGGGGITDSELEDVETVVSRLRAPLERAEFRREPGDK